MENTSTTEVQPEHLSLLFLIISIYVLTNVLQPAYLTLPPVATRCYHKICLQTFDNTCVLGITSNMLIERRHKTPFVRFYDYFSY